MTILSKFQKLPETDDPFKVFRSGPHYEILAFRQRQLLQDQMDVYNIFRKYGFLKDHFIDVGICANQHPRTTYHLNWLAQFSRPELDFWTLARSDLPLQLREGNRDPRSKLSGFDSAEVDDQLFTKYSETLANGILVRDTL